MKEEIFKGIGVEVDIKTPDNFLKIAETLTRIGIASKEENKLYQSCHILHKKDSMGKSRYSIIMFKEMFKLDGKQSSVTERDIERRNYIVGLLKSWNLIEILDKIEIADTVNVKVLPFKEKSKWKLISKYQIGKRKNG